jgi:predicted house-cleaning noncanonical NTP pyrophosphatase (MazG superfamily)
MAAQAQDGKLVRDRIPDIIRHHGGEPVTTVLSEPDYQVALRTKLQEEVDELLAASLESFPEELADVLEVLMSLAAISGLDWDVLDGLRVTKRAERGGFDGRVWLASSH